MKGGFCGGGTKQHVMTKTSVSNPPTMGSMYADIGIRMPFSARNDERRVTWYRKHFGGAGKIDQFKGTQL